MKLYLHVSVFKILSKTLSRGHSDQQYSHIKKISLSKKWRFYLQIRYNHKIHTIKIKGAHHHYNRENRFRSKLSMIIVPNYRKNLTIWTFFWIYEFFGLYGFCGMYTSCFDFQTRWLSSSLKYNDRFTQMETIQVWGRINRVKSMRLYIQAYIKK